MPERTATRMGRRKSAFSIFDKKEPEKPFRLCDKEGCCKAGEYRAPKDRTLKEHYWFCLEHVKEYNAAWDYYAGMSQEEIERSIEQDALGNRPLWPLGARHVDYTLFRDPLHVFPHERANGEAGRSQKPAPRVRHAEAVENAAALLELDFPLQFKQVRDNYKRLAKDCHPDTHGGGKEYEEQFKELAQAYRLIMSVLKKVV